MAWTVRWIALAGVVAAGAGCADPDPHRGDGGAGRVADGGSGVGAQAGGGTGGTGSGGTGSRSDGGGGVSGTTPPGDAAILPLSDSGTTDAQVSRAAHDGRRWKIAENLADPDVVALAGDRYVLSGTRDPALVLPFYESSDLVTWTDAGSYDPSAADPAYDYCWVWAPEIVVVGGTLTLYFSAHRGPNGGTSCPPASGEDVTTYRATSPDGTLAFGAPALLYQGGPGAQSRLQAGCPAGGCSRAIRIDASVYGDRLYYVYFDQGNNVASVALADGSDVRVHAGPAGWTLGAFEEGINEGPEILARDGRFYLFFSAAWFDSQYATFYVMADTPAELTRDRPLERLTMPVRAADGDLLESHGHNSVATREGETFNIFHQGVFDTNGNLIRRDAYGQRIAWNDDGTAVSQNLVRVSWVSIGGGNSYSLDLVLRDGEVVGPCIGAGHIQQATEIDYVGVCPDADDRLVHKSEVAAFRLFASPTSNFVQIGETPFDGYSDAVTIDTAP